MSPYKNVAFTIYLKILQVIKNNKFKTSEHGMTNLNYLMDILYLIFKIILSKS